MKYRLIGENDYVLNPVEVIFANRGVKDIDSFLNIDESVTHDWRLLDNIDKAVECTVRHLENDSAFFVQVDSDFDGYSSSASLINYLKQIKPNIKLNWDLHDNKGHGVLLDKVPDDTNVVFIPDAGSNQYDEHKQLKEQGIDVIVLDHHLCEKESEYAIVVNNQLSPNYPNKNFSGVGVVFKFLQAMDDKLKVRYADDYLDLVAMGNVADSMLITEPETRYYVKKGLQQIKNPLLQALIEKQSYSMKGIVNINNVNFYIAPLVNAVTRVGSIDEKKQVIRSLTLSNELIYNKRKNIEEDIHTATARMLTNIRNRQNKLRDKGVELIEERIKEKQLDKNKILIVNVTGLLDEGLGGLVANQISKAYRKPSMLIRKSEKKDGFYGGSARGYDKCIIKSFRDLLLETDKFEFCEGHENAFGYLINGNNLVAVNNIINEKFADVDVSENVYDVDFIIPANQLNGDTIKEIHSLQNEFSKGFEEPLFVIENIKLNKEDIKLYGKNKDTLKFNYHGVDFIKFKLNQKECNNIKNIPEGSGVSFTILGTADMNEYQGRQTPQIKIEDYTFIKEEKQYVF